MKHNILLLLAAGNIASSAMGMDQDKWDAQLAAQQGVSNAEQTTALLEWSRQRRAGNKSQIGTEAPLDQAEEAAAIQLIAEVAAEIRATDGAPSSIRQSKLYSRTSQPTKAIPSTPELAPESPSMAAQALMLADRALTVASSPEGQAALKFAGRAANSITALWQADGATAFKAYVAKSTALMQAETPSLEDINGIIEESFQADRHCVNGAGDVAKWGIHALEGFIEDNKDFLTSNQIALLKLRQKALDTKK